MDFTIETVTIEHVRYIVTKDPTNDRIISIFPDIQELKDKIDIYANLAVSIGFWHCPYHFTNTIFTLVNSFSIVHLFKLKIHDNSSIFMGASSLSILTE